MNMNHPLRRVAISLGEGYVSGLNAVISGVVLAADGVGCEVVGLHDGFDGLLEGARYRDGGVVPISRVGVERLCSAPGALLGTARGTDPFHAKTIGTDNSVFELDRSRELVDSLRAAQIDALIAVSGARDLTVALNLARRGVDLICIPKSVENDVGMTTLSFGFSTALAFVTDALESAREAARSMRRDLVVEVMGKHAGWLALQAGTAVLADAILIPEIPYDLVLVAQTLRARSKASGSGGLVVVAEGATPLKAKQGNGARAIEPGIQGGLCPATDPLYAEAERSSDRSDATAVRVAHMLERLTDLKTDFLVLGPMSRGGAPCAVDRQLGLAYGAAALRALAHGKAGLMVAFEPPHLRYVPLADAINQHRTVPERSDYLCVARALGICLGQRGET